MSGIHLCHRLEPGANAPWRDRCIEHAKAKFGASFNSQLDSLLRRSDLAENQRRGALRLAGHLADDKLADALEASWNVDDAKVDHLAESLWAFAQSGGEKTPALLTLACDLWSTLPDEPNKKGSLSPRQAVADNWLEWAFWRTLQTKALDYFIERAEQDTNLRLTIMYMLHGVDHPQAVEFVVRELARGLKEMEGTKQFWPFVRSVAEHWERKQRESGKPMSESSRQHLRTLWQNGANERHFRIQAFRVWAATKQPGDLAILRDEDLESVVGDDVLKARIERRDRTAVPAYVEKLRSDDRGAWWQYARHFWKDELTRELDCELARRGEAAERNWGYHYRSDWITRDLLTRRDASIAEALLAKHWSHLRFSPGFIHAALYTATPHTLALAQQALSECPDRREALKFLTHHIGLKMSGHPGVTRLEQMEALVPYLDDLDDMAIFNLWDLCNERSWRGFRKAHLDSRLAGAWRDRSGLEDALIMKELDNYLASERAIWLDIWTDHHLQHGVSRERLLQVCRTWLVAHQGPRALEVVTSVLIHIGRRQDADIAVAGHDGSELASLIIADTRYAIMRRSLS